MITNPIEEPPIAAVRKNAREEIRVAFRDHRGRRIVDVRVHELQHGKAIRTSNGLAIRPDLLDDVIAALQRAKASLPPNQEGTA